MDPALCRGARGLLNMTQRQLADAAGVSLKTVVNFEAGRHEPAPKNLRDIVQALEMAGVEFLNGDAPSVRLLPPKPGRKK